MERQETDKDQERCAIIVMTRYPETGKVKTRLISHLGEEGAARLHRKMAEYTMSTLRPLRDLQIADLWIFFSGGSTEEMTHWLGDGAEMHLQCGRDLGSRMAHAFEHVFAAGYNRAVMLGTDCPDIDGATIVKALKHLRSSDIVLGPALDGGYYLIALKQNHEELFQNISWGTDQVLGQTNDIIGKQHLSAVYLSPLRDIDTPEDLETLRGTILHP